MNAAYPWQFGPGGRTALANTDDHLRQMIEQLLLTNTGERVNRPDFGGGIYQLTFAPNSVELAATLQLTLQAGIQRYLADVVTVGGVSVNALDEKLLVHVSFQANDGTSSASVVTFELPVDGASL